MPHRAILPGSLVLLLLAACATSDSLGTLGDDGGAPSGDPQTEGEDAICLLHNCASDLECGACSDGRTTCLVDEKRCVACNAATNEGCPDGQYCSSWGNCVDDGVTCPTDAHGEPQISCASNADCGACDPLHQVCDTAASKCVACTAADTSACQSTDQCIAGECAPRCPSSCSVDADCASCGTATHPANACNAHRCAECSDTMPCPGGLSCSPQGACVEVCGTDGQGTCTTDAECDGCGADNNTCHTPINGGEGRCGVAATGCSDLGQGVVVLPSPFDQVTNLCSSEADCAGVGVDLNVGKMLRDLTGFDEIDDANIHYGMNECASVGITNDLSCGVCVPCKEDADCEPIDVDAVAGDAFGSLGAIAAALLLDQIFGPSDHKVHMYCEAVAGEYGACVPCPGFLQECGVGSPGGGGSTTCDHDVCTEGSALGAGCDACANTVCGIDDYCCQNQWDAQCIAEAEQYCGASCGGGTNPACHDVCVTGDPLQPSCGSCAASVCAQDAYCCNTFWDGTCAGYAETICGETCT